MPKDHKRDAPWDHFTIKGEREARAPWRNPGASDQFMRLPWDRHQVHSGRNQATRFKTPPRRYVNDAMGFNLASPLDRLLFDLSWGNPPIKDRHHRTLWGRKYYNEICWRRYEPPAGGEISFHHDTLITHVGDKDHITFYFDQYTYDRRCKWREPSGWRDAYFYTPPVPIPYGEFRRCYFMLNQALLTRLPERTPVDVSSITISTDIDSFCWSLSANLNSVAALDLLRPGAPVSVEANINGHLWNMQIERWSQGRRFAGGSRAVTGRSLSANLAAPFGPLITAEDGNDRTAEQLALAALDEAALAGVSGWTVDWDMVDWLVPGGLWKVAEQSPMQAIQDIARCGHGFVQTHRTSKVLLVLPRYSVMPWAWDSATPAVIIPEAMILSMDGGWEPSIQYNAAFVAGTATGGISAKVTRTGTAGDVAAPMFTHPLMSDTDVALVKGLGIIADSGDWEQCTFSIPLFPSGTQPGLVLPGTLIQISNGVTTWNGHVIGTSVTASRSRGGVIVRQSLTVEKYHGN